MVTAHLISAYVTSETKARFRNLAEQQQMSESGSRRRLVDSAVGGAVEIKADALRPPGRRLRGSRMCVRIHPDDKLLLSERAAARQMAVAAYISVLLRAHLRNLSLKHSVAEVGAIGRNLNQLTRLEGFQLPARPYRLGELPMTRLNAVLNACSDS